jgi:O-succinylbenzoate synthase
VAGFTVTRARLYEVALPLREPFRISHGSLSVRRSLIVELVDSAGNIGLGESAPFEAPFYSAETVASARPMLLDHLLPRLVGQELGGPSEMFDCLSQDVVGNRMALAGADTAWWDLWSQVSKEPLAELVTKRLRELQVPPHWLESWPKIRCGVAIGIPESGRVDDVKTAVAAAIERGYRRVKLKIKPGWDLEPVFAALDVMEQSGAEIPLTVDGNGSYRLDRHKDRLIQLGKLGLLFIEQPLPGDALWDLRKLGSESETGVCLDESLTSAAVARQVVEMGGPMIWNIKVQRVGGLEQACRIYRVGAESEARLWGGTMPETGIGAQAMLALGCHAGFVYASDIEPSERWYEAGTDPVELTMGPDGTMSVPPERPSVSRKGWELVGEVS